MDFYSSSARILDAVQAAATPPSLKQLCTQHAGQQGSPTRCYALVAETLKYLPVLEKLLKSIDILKAEAKILSKKASPSSRSLVLVLMHDLLFNKRGIALPKEHKIRMAVEGYSTRLKANLQREKLKQKVTSNEALQVSVEQYISLDIKGKKRATIKGETDAETDADSDKLEGKIRWLRVNKNKWTVDAAEDWLDENGWKQLDSLKALVKTGGRHFCLDEHIPNLLAFPIGSVSLPKFQPYMDSRLIAQDKASCMPAYLLLAGNNRQNGVTVIDATSAPGNKTSYVSATLHADQLAKVYACERDPKRFQTLTKMLKKAGCRNTEAVLTDFLQIDPQEEPYCNATHILVDPSCSGSGIHEDEEETPTAAADLEARLTPLSNFQRYILAHALSFPKVEQVVYSTCSVHQEENEQVVFSTLEQEGIDGVWDVARRQEALPDWPLRGQLLSDDAGPTMQKQTEGLIRCERRMGTHGFFVAVFVRRTVVDDGDRPVLPAELVSAQVGEKPEAVTEVQGSSNGQGSELSSTASTSKDFSLLRLATVDRKRRRDQELIRIARKAARYE